MSDPNPARLAALAAKVADQHGTMQAAIADAREAEAQLLAQIVDAVRPALKALSSRIKASERTWWPTSTETATEKSYHPERGIFLDGTGPERDHPRANDGAILGRDLFLLDDATFAVLDWSGNWTRWQGRTSEETSTLTRITLRDVVDEWDAETIAADLADRLQAQVEGKAPKTTQAARDRATKLRSVSTLLAGGRK